MSLVFPCTSAPVLALAFLWAGIALAATPSVGTDMGALDYHTVGASNGLTRIDQGCGANELNASLSGRLNVNSALPHCHRNSLPTNQPGSKYSATDHQSGGGHGAFPLPSGSKNVIRVNQNGFAHRTGVSRYRIPNSSPVELIDPIHSVDIYQSGNGLYTAVTQHGAGFSAIVNQYD